MIEQAMYFALGACVAGLLALLCLPAIARRALRLAQVAVERQMPISVEEIVAQRDLLRAEFATERRRLEQTLEEAQASQARDMSEIGRRVTEISRLGADLHAVASARDTATAAAALSERLLNETSAENIALQKGLYDADGEAERLRRLLDASEGAHRALTLADAGKQTTIEQLTGELTEGANQYDVIARKLAQTRLDLSVASARAETLQAQIDNHERTIDDARQTEADLRRRIDEANNHAIDADDIAQLRRTIVEIGREVVRLSHEDHTLASREEDERRAPVSVN